MSADDLRAEDARDWLVHASKDLRRAGILIAADPPDPEGALFHCQQSAEKALKGFLTWHDVPFRRTHELDELGQQCVALDQTLGSLVEQADSLTKYASMFRYPGAGYEPGVGETRSMHLLAKGIVDAILTRLPKQVRP